VVLTDLAEVPFEHHSCQNTRRSRELVLREFFRLIEFRVEQIRLHELAYLEQWAFEAGLARIRELFLPQGIVEPPRLGKLPEASGVSDLDLEPTS
jgi:hypothetical protein